MDERRDVSQSDQPYEPPVVEEVDTDTDLIATSPGFNSNTA